MREIIFRGQTRRYGEKVRMGDGEKLPSKWVYGGIFPGTGCYSVIYGAETEDFTGADIEKHTVYSDTVGQYTGLTDKNGERIFEGDVVGFNRHNALGYLNKRVGEVKYYTELPVFYILATTGDAWDWCDCFNIEVIGNIHDNPELIGGNND